MFKISPPSFNLQSLVFWVKKATPLLVILALAIFLRTYNILNTTSIMGDTGRDLLVAKHLANFSAPFSARPATTNSFLSNSPLYFLIIGFLWFLAPSIEGMIILFAIIQSLVVLVAYALGKKIENKTAGYYLAFYTAINPIFVEASRWVWQMHLLILFIPLLVFVFFNLISVKSLNKASLKLAIFFVVSNILIHLHYSTFILVILMFIWVLIKSFKTKQKRLIIFTIMVISFSFRLSFSFNLNYLIKNYSQASLITTNAQQIVSNINIATQALFNINDFWLSDIYQSLLIGSLILIFLFFYLSFFKESASYQSFNKYTSTLIILSISGFLYIFYGGYFFPFLILFHLQIPLAIFYICKSGKEFKNIGIILGLLLVFLYLQSVKIKLIYWPGKEIALLEDISQKISLDVSKNNNSKHFSINLINEVYELTDSDSTFNSALWLFLEEKLQKELVVISNSQPTVVEPENFNTLYQVTINENNEDEKYTIEKFYIEQ
ncbi:MAG: hypothetical protein A2383_00735 [Candidatus Pacebacteria bacterium RIFOXYB1_FULL_39_46]|nr:MAG: hypothetical protein A2182_00570 [Candidatus Pacebacteria bacterium RIFOXYA1_FULL_38_18]OGJ38113.1 MAG: hypothetical protein A2383_00735 [Candidatus Pacebacteria bacterium RIFOXYB1_FULL_39_46]OGJ39665.1 MAG: hypothetical protein A2411_02705 [Candidatus Pacebacteria bacterium RIFOXYC1_FULL_39_21]OGJ39865.1 MAG: hypothetical protein A2582_00500 [Candidatus Pacebacteria bacterium RIFOXYD1_FULL_39_27]